MDICDVIQESVDKILEKNWENDECKPVFIVSLFQTGEKESVQHQLLLTIRHCGFSVSRVIFPRIEYKYGYESIEQEMEWLYNTTM